LSVVDIMDHNGSTGSEGIVSEETGDVSEEWAASMTRGKTPHNPDDDRKESRQSRQENHQHQR